MKRFTSIASIFALALVVLALPSIASAQGRGRNQDDDYYRNSGYGRNIRGTVESLRNRARNFERQVDRIDDRRGNNGRNNDRYGGYNNGGYNNSRYDNLEGLSDRFARATDDLADAYGRGRNMNNSRDEARRVLAIGYQMENVLRRSRTNRSEERRV